jgi:outer membrane protein TolC
LRARLARLRAVALGCSLIAGPHAIAQESAARLGLPQPLSASDSIGVAAPSMPESRDRPLPITLPSALQLANVQPIDIQLAAQRIEVAAAALERAKVLWVPTLYLGGDYFRHDGQVQDVAGNVAGTSKQSLMLGAGPSMVFALSDAIYAPLVERQVVRAREAGLQTARNDSMLAVAEAYFAVQQARGELAGAEDAARRGTDVVRRTELLAAGGDGIIAELDVVRARADFARRDQALDAARQRWRIASADLVRVLRLDSSAVLEPLEPPNLQVTLVPLDANLDSLIPIGLTNRPELASQQALVQAALARIRLEKMRPLIPSLLLRGASTNPTGTLGVGYFGGGVNGGMRDFNARTDLDFQVIWELQNLGFGNAARVHERQAENQVAILELFRTQDRIAAEIAQAYALAQSAASRLGKAETGLRLAVDSANKHVEGLGLTKSAGKLIVLVIRPQEVLAAIQALAQSYDDYYLAVADYDRAQFRLYRALGNPAQCLKADTLSQR